jgi:hypothetical protein
MAAEDLAFAIPKPRKKAPTSNSADFSAQSVIKVKLQISTTQV